MDLQIPARIKYLGEKIVVLLGAAEPDSASIAAETATLGDPTFAGALAGVPLGLSVEPEIKAEVAPNIHGEQMAMMEMVLDVDRLTAEVSKMRQEGSKF